MDFRSRLNPEQLAAVTHDGGPLLVVAGAGSGKTRVITYRIAWLIAERQVEPWRIAAVTFTNKAADEMRGRALDLVGGNANVFVGTFHRFCVRLLRRHGDRVGLRPDFAIVDAPDQLRLIKASLKAENLDEQAFQPRAVQGRISGAKNRLLTPAAFEKEAEDFFDRHVAAVFRRYQAELRRTGGVDFDDLIALAVCLLRDDEEVGARVRGRFRHLLVDEFQDTNAAQLELVRNLVLDPNGSVSGLTAVGDEDQSIYGWRGAELDNLLRFEQHFPGGSVRKLERNYRSTQNILDASGAVISRNEQRRGKTLWTDKGAGEPLQLFLAGDHEDEARWVVGQLAGLRTEGLEFGDMAVLVRTNAQTRAIEDQLLRGEVPYCLVAGIRFYERAEVKDLIAYLRVIANPQDNLSLRRILNQPRRGIGGRTEEVLLERAAEMGNSLWDAIRLDPLQELPARSLRAVRNFRGLIEALRQEAERQPLAELVRGTIVAAGFEALYGKGDEEGQERLENLNELVSSAHDFETLHGLTGVPARNATPAGNGQREAAGEETLFDEETEPAVSPLVNFLDYVSLVSDTDGLNAELGVAVMTLHSAKGLEYPAVFVTGLEDGLLPHFHAGLAARDIEEERRLFYVGMTRAEQRLFLSLSRRRMVAGQFQDQQPSPFIADLPEELVETTRSAELFGGPRTAGVRGFFGGDRAAGGASFRAASPAAARRARKPPTERIAGVLRPGAVVRHATLGKGVVLQLDGDGENAKLIVFFDKAGKRKLIRRYAPLDVL
ncbi:MAG: AAA family ATPase [Holophagales bacterium]|nr:AAA family ATPase [Holophagales bacterium]MYC09108.1 AAA family ATPase [Holophagales bacterium]